MAMNKIMAYVARGAHGNMATRAVAQAKACNVHGGKDIMQRAAWQALGAWQRSLIKAAGMALRRRSVCKWKGGGYGRT